MIKAKGGEKEETNGPTFSFWGKKTKPLCSGSLDDDCIFCSNWISNGPNTYILQYFIGIGGESIWERGLLHKGEEITE